MVQAAPASSPAAQPADLALRTVHVDDSDENISPSWSRRIVLVQAEATAEGEWEEGEMASQPSLSPVGARPIELVLDRDGPRVLSSDRGNMPSQGGATHQPKSRPISPVKILPPGPTQTEARSSPPRPQSGPSSSAAPAAISPPISPITVTFPTPRPRSLQPIARRVPLNFLERSPSLGAPSFSPSQPPQKVPHSPPKFTKRVPALLSTTTRSEIETSKSIWPTRGRPGGPRSKLQRANSNSSSSALSATPRDTRPASSPSRHSLLTQRRTFPSSPPSRHSERSLYPPDDRRVPRLPTTLTPSSSNRSIAPSSSLPRRRSLSPSRPPSLAEVPQRSFTSLRYKPPAEQQQDGLPASKPSRRPLAPGGADLCQPARGRSTSPPRRGGSPSRSIKHPPPREIYDAGHRRDRSPTAGTKTDLGRRWKQNRQCDPVHYDGFSHDTHELGKRGLRTTQEEKKEKEEEEEEEEERVAELARRAAFAPPKRSPMKSVSPPEFRTCERPFCARSVHDFGLYKTVICKYWELKMACPKGTRCTYAHGPKELRSHVCSHAKQTSPRWKDRRELVAVSEHAHQKRRASGGRNKSNRSLSPTQTRPHDGERRRLGEEFRYRARSNSPSALMAHSSAAPATIRKRRRSIDLPWGRGLRNISKKRRKRRLSASSTGSGSSGLADTDPRRRDRSLNPSVPPRVKRNESNDDDFDDDDHIMFSFVEPIVEDKDDSIAGDQDEDPYSPLYSPFSIIETDSEPTPQSRERSTVSPFLERVCPPRSPLAPMSSVVPVQIQPLFPPLAPTATASTSAHAPAPALPLPPSPAPQPRPASPVVIENRLVPSDRDYFRTYFAELARRKKTVRPIL